MKRLLTGAGIGAIAILCTATLAAQAPANRTDVEKTLMANEEKVSGAFDKSDAATMKMYVADGAMAADATGFNTTDQLFQNMPTMKIAVTDAKLSDFKVVWADARTAIVTYTWTGKGSVAGQPVTSPSYCSTVWTQRGGQWLAVYHQETGAAPAPISK